MDELVVLWRDQVDGLSHDELVDVVMKMQDLVLSYRELVLEYRLAVDSLRKGFGGV